MAATLEGRGQAEERGKWSHQCHIANFPKYLGHCNEKSNASLKENSQPRCSNDKNEVQPPCRVEHA